MRRELLWAALWLLAGIGLGLATGRPATGQGLATPAPAQGVPGLRGTVVAVPGPGASTGPAAPAQGGGEPPPGPEIGRYAGLWYDLAATPDRFHEGCSRDATTRYTPRADASLQIENLCRGEGGDLRDAVGVLRPDRSGRRGAELQLSYAPDWLAWLPLAWSEVRVVERDAAYRYVVMATPDREHLWVLSRTPAMAPADYEALLGRAQAQGFSTARLRRIPQEGADRREEDGDLP